MGRLPARRSLRARVPNPKSKIAKAVGNHRQGGSTGPMSMRASGSHVEVECLPATSPFCRPPTSPRQAMARNGRI
jgi:hypothetical protein